VTSSVRRFRLDRTYRRPGAGRVVIGGSPLRLLTVADAAVPLLEGLERDGTVTAGGAGVDRLLARLVDLGVVHPLPSDPALDPALDHAADAEAEGSAVLTVVVPCRRTGGPHGGGAPVHPVWRSASVLVDDASTPPLVAPPGTRLLRLDTNVGPGGARNAGLAEVTTLFVAFVDADVEVDETALVSLLEWFDDPQVALVAPRVRAAGGASWLARFEVSRSPLDLGDEPARVAPTTRVSYVPAAVVIARVDALRAVGGFDAALRWGEDVDLVWRLIEAGWRCRYEPSVEVRHRTRDGLRPWVGQRFRYGTSAAPLEERHPGALAPVRMSGWSVATWAPVAAGWPLVGAAIGAGSAAALTRKLRQVPASEAWRIAGLGNLYAGRLLAGTLTRAWWPIALPAALLSRRARRVVIAAAVVPVLLDLRRERPALDPVRYAVLHLLDDLSYGAGVWVGAWRQRSLGALRPRFESWPPRDRGGAAGGGRFRRS
jgi:mycofactocin system glycosyltransferase